MRFQLAALALTGLVFAFFMLILLPFVPAQGLIWQYVWAGFTAFPLAGTFFFSAHMFWVVFVESTQARKAS